MKTLKNILLGAALAVGIGTTGCYKPQHEEYNVNANWLEHDDIKYNHNEDINFGQGRCWNSESFCWFKPCENQMCIEKDLAKFYLRDTNDDLKIESAKICPQSSRRVCDENNPENCTYVDVPCYDIDANDKTNLEKAQKLFDNGLQKIKSAKEARENKWERKRLEEEFEEKLEKENEAKLKEEAKNESLKYLEEQLK